MAYASLVTGFRNSIASRPITDAIAALTTIVVCGPQSPTCKAACA